MSNELEILGLLKSGQAFINPVGELLYNATNNVNISVSNLQANINTICASIWPAGVPYSSEFTTGDANNINEVISATLTSLWSMIDHTNLLSGITINGEKNIAAVIDLTLTAKETDVIWNVSKNINTHPLYESASVLFRTDELTTVINSNVSILHTNLSFFNDTTNTINYLITNVPAPAEQRALIRGKIEAMYISIININDYLVSVLNHDIAGWNAVQRRVFLKLFAIKLDSYTSNTEASQFVKLSAQSGLSKFY